MRPFISSIVLVASILLAGCVSTTRSAREVFLSSVPVQRDHYLRFYEVSIGSVREREDRIYGLTAAFVRAMRETGGECLTNSCPAMEARLERIELISETLHKPALKQIDELETAYDPKTDTIFYFAWKDGDQQEAGYLVVCGTKVKKKVASFE